MKKQTIGYASHTDQEEVDEENLLQYISAQDIKNFGLIPELIGRLPVVTHLNPLDAEALKRILTEPKNALTKQYKKLFKMDDIELEIEEPVLDLVVEKAMEFNLGARGLRSICEAILIDAMFELPSSDDKHITITRDYAEDKLSNATISKLKAA